MKGNKKTVLNLNQNFSGYTLVEVVLVMVFVSLSFMSLYAIFAKTIQGDTESRNEIIASNLAQECIERVRNCRDEKVLNDPAWGINDLDDCNNKTVLPSSIFDNFKSGGTIFNTNISINNEGENDKIVTCTTSWTSSLGNDLDRKVVLKSLLSNWQKQNP